MGLRNCFVDKHGNVWREETLKEAAKPLLVEPFRVKDIPMDKVIHWKVTNVKDCIVHFSRLRAADCSIPIILKSDGVVMDGWHRIIKALIEGEELTAKQFKVDPPPDFKSVL